MERTILKQHRSQRAAVLIQLGLDDHAARHAVGRRGVVMVARKEGMRLFAGYYLAPEKQRAAIGTRGGEGHIMRYAQHG